MLTPVLVCVATAWTLPPTGAAPTYQYRQYQPAVGYQPAPVAGYYVATAPASVPVRATAPAGALALGVAALGLGAFLGYGAGRNQAVLMAKGFDGTRAKRIPKGPLGDSVKAGDNMEDAWIGDQGRSEQVKKFEAAEDYLFFQGPAPKSAIQDDLPDFFSAENFTDMKVTVPQILAVGTSGVLVLVFAYLLATT